jgi:poly(hydroxyalkanoate) depolymerase family esterase
MGVMVKRKRATSWAGIVARNVQAMSRVALRLGRQAANKAMAGKGARRPAVRRAPPRGAGDWIAGVAIGPAGARRYHLFRPSAIAPGERLPLLVMLHGCGQDAPGFAASTRMNAIAARERFLVLYPEQERLANPQGCWNWFDTRSGRAQGEAGLILAAVDQVSALYRVDPARVAICGLSAGAGMAALVAARDPARFAAVAMHSGVPIGSAQSAATAIAAMAGRRTTRAAVSARALPPLLVIQGDADRVVAPVNARAAASAWAQAGGASAATPREGVERVVRRGRRKAMRVTEFKRRALVVVTLVEIEGLGHAWSGGAASQPFGDVAGPDASRLVWAFAAKQFRAADGAA